MRKVESVLMRRGLNRVEAASYVGVSPTSFDQMVVMGEMPEPRVWRSRKIWDRLELDAAFDELPTAGQAPAKPAATGWEDIVDGSNKATLRSGIR